MWKVNNGFFVLVHCTCVGLNLHIYVPVLQSRPFRDLSTCLNFEIVRYIKIETTEAIESNDLNIEN